MSGDRFWFVDRPDWRMELGRYRSDAWRAYESGRYTAVWVYLRAALEGLLIWRLEQDRAKALRAYEEITSRRVARGGRMGDRQEKDIHEWDLFDLINVSQRIRVWDGESAHSFRCDANDNAHWRSAEAGRAHTELKEDAYRALRQFDGLVTSIGESAGSPLPKPNAPKALFPSPLNVMDLGILHDRLGDREADTVGPPILFFGDIGKAKVASVGFLPSPGEYRLGEPLARLRDERLDSPENRRAAIEAMAGYFYSGGPYAWFRHLELIAAGMGLSYRSGQVVHLDLVQEVKERRWEEMDYDKWEALLDRNIGFVGKLIAQFKFKAILCVASSVQVMVKNRLPGLQMDKGITNTKYDVRWFAFDAQLGEDRFGLAGWNEPLYNPPYRSWPARRFRELGQALAAALKEKGYLAAP